MAHSVTKTDHTSPEQLKTSLCKKIVDFQKRKQLKDGELARVLQITATQTRNILAFNTDKISLSTLCEIEAKISA